MESGIAFAFVHLAALWYFANLLPLRRKRLLSALNLITQIMNDRTCEKSQKLEFKISIFKIKKKSQKNPLFLLEKIC